VMPQLVQECLRCVSTCKCDRGCPGCIFSQGCGCLNESMDKAGTLFVCREVNRIMFNG
jgi:ATP-dependent helicase YprA (DUF1998 family)